MPWRAASAAAGLLAASPPAVVAQPQLPGDCRDASTNSMNLLGTNNNLTIATGFP